MSAIRHPADERYDFFTSTDPWCRPVRVVNAPDGSVWVVDMVRKVIEHPEWIPTAWQQRINLRDGSQLGRIYRVYHRQRPPTNQWTIGSDADALIAAISSSNGSLRDQALLQILWLDARELNKWNIEERIRKLASGHQNPSVRISCLGCLAGRNWLTEADVLKALKESDPRLARYALTLAEKFSESEAINSAMLELVDRNLGAQVDLQWILTSTRITSLDSTAALRQILKRSRGDVWINRASSLVRRPAQALAVLQGMLDELQQRKTLEPREYSSVVADARKLWRKLADGSQQSLVQTFIRRRELDSDAAFSCPDLVLLTLISEMESKPQGMEQVLSTAQGRMMDESAPEEERIVLVNLVGSGLASAENELRFADQLLRSSNSTRVKQSVISAVRNLTLPAVADTLLAQWSGFTPKQKQLACGTLLSRREWVEDLILALESGDVSRADLDPATVQRLRSYNDRGLRSRCLAVFGKPTPRSEVVSEYLEQMPAPELTASSRRLFADHCAACHTSIEGKPMIGPPLENLGHWTIDQWVTAIMDPNQAVEPKYKQQMLLTDDDQIYVGLIQDESGSDYVLAQSDGTQRSIPKQSVVETRSGELSLMPEGFEQKLSPQQLSLLLGWLRNQPSGEAASSASPQPAATSLR
jgi:putative heme-binding domain-containing protein